MNIYSLIRFLEDLQMKYQNKFTKKKILLFFFVYMHFNINVNEKEYCLNSIHDHVF